MINYKDSVKVNQSRPLYTDALKVYHINSTLKLMLPSNREPLNRPPSGVTICMSSWDIIYMGNQPTM